MKKTDYDAHGRVIAHQLPLAFKDLPIIGGTTILRSEHQPSDIKSGAIFYLADHFIIDRNGRCMPRYFPSSYKEYENIFEAAREVYPKEMLPSDSKLYAIVNGEVFEGKTKKVKPFEALEDFVDYVQTTEKKEGTTVVSFSKRDFDALAHIIEILGGKWGISGKFYNDMLYRVHIYGSAPPLPAPTRK